MKYQLMLDEFITGYKKNCTKFLHDINNSTIEIRKSNREIAHQDCGAWIDSPSLCPNGYYPIHYACFVGDIDIMQILINNGGTLA